MSETTHYITSKIAFQPPVWGITDYRFLFSLPGDGQSDFEATAADHFVNVAFAFVLDSRLFKMYPHI